MHNDPKRRRLVRLAAWVFVALGLLVGSFAKTTLPADAQGGTVTFSIAAVPDPLQDVNGQTVVTVSMSVPSGTLVGAATMQFTVNGTLFAVVDDGAVTDPLPDCSFVVSGTCGPPNPTDTVSYSFFDLTGVGGDTALFSVPLQALGSEGVSALTISVSALSDEGGGSLPFLLNQGSVTIASPTATNTPIPTATNTPLPTATNTPLPTATNTPVPTATNTPLPTATNTPVPTVTPGGPTVTNTPIPTATNTPVPTATNTPLPTATNTPLPTATNTPLPTQTPGGPTATNTPLPTATSTPDPAAATPTSPSGATGDPALVYGGPFNDSPTDLSTSPNGIAFEVPNLVPDALGTGGASGSDDPGLANTGSSPILASFSIALLGLGGVLLVASRRDPE